MRRLLRVAVPGILAIAQTPAADEHSGFEVASIKPSNPGATAQDMQIGFPPGGRFEAENITLQELLLSFSGFSGRVREGPGWVASDRYDISAKAEREIAPGERNGVLMKLLEDRFRLKIHREDTDVPGMSLVQGKTPVPLKPAAEGEVERIRTDENHQVNFEACGMFHLARYFSQILHMQVVDRTGVRGRYDFRLNPDAFAAPNDTYADRVRAAAEQLGLILETEKVPVQVTVINHVERPSVN